MNIYWVNMDIGRHICTGQSFFLLFLCYLSIIPTPLRHYNDYYIIHWSDLTKGEWIIERNDIYLYHLEFRFKGICACVELGFQWRAMKFDKGVVGLDWVRYGAIHRPVCWKRYERCWCFFCVVLWGLWVYFPEDFSMSLIFSCDKPVRCFVHNIWHQNWTDADPCIVNTTGVLMSVMRLRPCNYIRCRYYWGYYIEYQ